VYRAHTTCITAISRPRYFAVVSRQAKAATAPQISPMPISPERRAAAASRAAVSEIWSMTALAGLLCDGHGAVAENAAHGGLAGT
jgi:hypothetical protein